MSTWNSENTAIRSPANRMSASRTPKNGDDSRPARRKRQRPLRRQERQRHHGQRPAPAGPAAEPQVVPTIAQTSATQLHRHRHLQNPGFLEMASRKPASHPRTHKPAHRGERPQ